MNCVYALVDPRNNHARYVGVTINPKVRLSQHCTAAKKKSKVTQWVHRLKEEGIRPHMVILEEGLSTTQSRISECFWLEYLRFLGADLTNMRNGGGGGAIFDN